MKFRHLRRDHQELVVTSERLYTACAHHMRGVYCVVCIQLFRMCHASPQKEPCIGPLSQTFTHATYTDHRPLSHSHTQPLRPTGGTYPGIHVGLADGVLPHVSPAAVKLHALIRDPVLQVGDPVLAHGGHAAVQLALAVQLDALVGEGAVHGNLSLHRRQTVLDRLWNDDGKRRDELIIWTDATKSAYRSELIVHVRHAVS